MESQQDEGTLEWLERESVAIQRIGWGHTEEVAFEQRLEKTEMCGHGDTCGGSSWVEPTSSAKSLRQKQVPEQ